MGHIKYKFFLILVDEMIQKTNDFDNFLYTFLTLDYFMIRGNKFNCIANCCKSAKWDRLNLI